MATHRARLASAALLASCASACAGRPPVASPPPRPPAESRESTAQSRERLSITVYGEDFGLVREVRSVDLGPGRVALEFRDVAEHIQPETVHIKSLSAEGGLEVFEQNYRYDLLTPQKLLEKYVGRHVTLHRYNEATGGEQDFDAEVLAVQDNQAVFKVNGEVTYGFPGRISFPNVPANLIAKPTLVLLLGAKEPKQKLEVTYVTNHLAWRSDYVLTVDAQDALADLVGWVTLTNHSGASYENAELKLVAGDVRRVGVVNEVRYRKDEGYVEDKKTGFAEEGLFEYHLYTLDHPTTLLDNEQKQVMLLEAHSVHVDKRLLFFGGREAYRGKTGALMRNKKVGVYLDIENREKNGLGIPLPRGTLRVYKADASGAKQFVGEDRIDHTPRDETIRVKLGDAFDVVGDRKQTAWLAISTCQSESAWEISLRNHKDVAQAVQDVEPVDGDWEIVQSSHPATKKDARTFTFDVSVPARGEVKITYRVRVRWC
jgi:hypothetical protein